MHVNLLFGFLGSGKTTLAKHLLAERGSDMKTAVIVNEFGEVGVDGEILRGNNVDVVELNSGCLCCTLRGSLMLAVEELREKAKVERVIVEATGVAQPGELLETLADAKGEALDIGPLVTVVDTFKFPKLMAMLGDFYGDQIENADIIVMNKIDLVTSAQLEEVTRQVREMNSHAELVFAEQGKVRSGDLLEGRPEGLLERLAPELQKAPSGAPEARHGIRSHADHHDHDHGHGHEHHHHGHDHAHGPHTEAPVESFVVRGAGSARRLDLERFFATLGDDVYRAKGFIHVDGEPVLVQYSLGQLEITPAGQAAADAMVFIGNGMDRPRIETAFGLMGRG